ncbi:MAG: prepilin-type N-terminal cleavage/methylation domain-containing protein [Candidatus Omnitrophota bacterium]|jgi:prepilin-type N-terminal cleavage/methylation domain-containing protein
MSRTGNKGFTLIEVMAASAILAFGVVFVYEALFRTLDAFNYYENYLKNSNWMDEKIWQAQDELSNSGVYTGEGSGEYLNNNRQVRWELACGPQGDQPGLFSIDLRLAFPRGNKNIYLSRSAYALSIARE